MRRAVSARHTSELEALLVDDRFDGDVYPSEPMARHTMYRIGGPARFNVQVASVGALARLVEVCERTGVPWTVVGRGSNLLVADEAIKPLPVATGKASMPAHARETLADLGATLIPAGDLAREAGSAKSTNVVLLGALSTRLPFPVEAWERVVADRVPPKTVDANLAAFRAGRAFGEGA